MAAPKSKTLSLIFRALTRKTTRIASKPTSIATKPTKSVARSTTKSPKLASSSSSASDVSDSEPFNHSCDDVCLSVFEKDQSSNGSTSLSKLVSYHLSDSGPEPSQGVIQDEHVEFSDKPLVRQVSSTISGKPLGGASSSRAPRPRRRTSPTIDQLADDVHLLQLGQQRIEQRQQRIEERLTEQDRRYSVYEGMYGDIYRHMFGQIYDPNNLHYPRDPPPPFE